MAQQVGSRGGTQAATSHQEPRLRAIPADHEAERAVLGAILLDHNSLYKIEDKVTPVSFDLPRHQTLYRACLALAEKQNAPIDSVLIKQKMLDAKTFTECLRNHTEREVYKIMAWRDGDFYFEKASSPAFANPVRLKVEDLLLEGARRSDEWMLIQQKIPDFNVVFEPLIADAVELTKRGLSDVDASVFSLIDGKRSLQEIIDSTCFGEFEVAKAMFILLSVNLIRAKK